MIGRQLRTLFWGWAGNPIHFYPTRNFQEVDVASTPTCAKAAANSEPISSYSVKTQTAFTPREIFGKLGSLVP